MSKNRKNRQVIDFMEARELRKEKRDALAVKKAKNTPAPKRKNKARVFVKLYAVITLAFIAVICTIAYSVVALQTDLEKAQLDNEAAVQKKERLEYELEHINDPENIERQARTRLRMVKPDDVIYVVPEIIDEKNRSDGDSEGDGEGDGDRVDADGSDGIGDGGNETGTLDGGGDVDGTGVTDDTGGE